MGNYRTPSLDLSNRIEIAAEMAQSIEVRGWGRVSELAREYGVSRQTLYNIRNQAQNAMEAALQPKTPGPKPANKSLKIDDDYLRRAMTILGTHKGSIRDIQQALKLLFGEDRSVGGISETLQAVGKAAADYHSQLVLDQLMLGEADEIFQHGQPCLTVVDGRSFMVLHLAASTQRDATAWGLAFLTLKEQGIQFHDVVTDGAAGIGAGLRAADIHVPLRPDLFHLLQNAKRAGKKLESAAYDAIAVAESARHSAQTVAQAWNTSLVEDEAKEQVALDAHDNWQWLTGEIRRALHPFTDGGLLRSATQSCEALGVIVELMGKVAHRDCTTFAGQLDRLADDLVAPLAWLEQTLAPWRETLDPDDERLITWAWRHQQALGLTFPGDGFPEALHPVVAAFWAALDLFHRASSLAESFHAWLRPYLEIHRSMPDWLLPLLMLVWNHHTFTRGKRAGSSPIQLAGVDDPPSLSDVLDIVLAAAFPTDPVASPIPLAA